MGKNKSIYWMEKKFKKFKLQINPVFLFNNPITGEENKIHRYTNPQIILTSDDFEEYIENLKSKFTSIIDDMQQRESQWIFIRIISSHIFLYNVTDVSARSYIKSPFISKSILNIQNDDDKCFLYSILAYFYYDIEKTHRTRSSTYEKYIDFENQTAKLPNEKTLNFKDIEFPFKYKDIPKFEKLNQFLTVNVFGIKEFTKDEIEPITKMSKEEKNIILIYC